MLNLFAGGERRDERGHPEDRLRRGNRQADCAAPAEAVDIRFAIGASVRCDTDAANEADTRGYVTQAASPAEWLRKITRLANADHRWNFVDQNEAATVAVQPPCAPGVTPARDRRCESLAAGEDANHRSSFHETLFELRPGKCIRENAGNAEHRNGIEEGP